MVEVVRKDHCDVPSVAKASPKSGEQTIETAWVSVVIPVYNGEAFVAEAIESALDQTYDNVEVIVVNDGSTDQTSSILEAYGNRLKVISTENGGLSVARNIGILASTGRFVAFLDADDIWHPLKLSFQVRALEQNPDWVVVCNRRVKFGDTRELRIDDIELLIQSHSPDAYPILHRNPVHASSVLVRKQALAHAGLFVPKLGGAAEDTEMWARLSKLGTVAVCEPHLTYMRDHASNTTKTYQYRKQKLATLDFMRHRWSHDPRAVDILNRNLSANAVAFAYEASERGQYSLARRYFYQAFRLNPGRIKWLLKTLLYLGRPDVERL